MAPEDDIRNAAPWPRAGWTSRSAAELARLIAAGETTSREVVEAHLARIHEVNGRINAVVELFEDSALRAADEADAARARGDALGPFHGVPITIKECFHVAGSHSTLGFTHRTKVTNQRDGLLVERLRRAGAILLGKTNVPQAMLMHETDNPVFGPTRNPWNLERTSGGSSGGEAAIIAAGGSPLGLASDLGGSIRTPAHFCGLVGIKPTSRCVSTRGTQRNLRGMETIQFQPGPLARSVDDLELMLRGVVGGPPRRDDSQTVPGPLPRSAEVEVAKLRIGWWDDDGAFPASAAVRRAVREAAQRLESAGLQVARIDPPDMAHGLQLYCGILSADGGADLRALLGGSNADRRISEMLRTAGWPAAMRRVVASLLRTAGDLRRAELLLATGPRTADEYWQLTRAATVFRRRFGDRLEQEGIDIVLAPPFALPAFPHGLGNRVLAAGSYAFLANLLDAPAGVVPVTRVRENEQNERPASRDSVMQAAAQTDEGSAGLPVGVQVIGRPWREDQVLAVMRLLWPDAAEG